jgi:hypothetical protein
MNEQWRDAEGTLARVGLENLNLAVHAMIEFERKKSAVRTYQGDFLRDTPGGVRMGV